MSKTLYIKLRDSIFFKIIIISIVAMQLILSSVFALEPYNPKTNRSSKKLNIDFTISSRPIVEYAAHNRGNIQLAVGNNGTFGTEGGTIPDPLTGQAIASCVYPKGSDIVFLWVAALWVGAIVGRDTLVSCADEDWYETYEFWPDLKPAGDFRLQSIDINSENYSPEAYSEEDYICYYTDTLTDPGLVKFDTYDQRPHRPLNIKVYQRTMAWSYSYADDFILFDYEIENIGMDDLKEVYIGIFVDGDVWHTTRNGPEGWNDDIVGFYRTHKITTDNGCEFIDTVNIAFTADNDGDPENGKWDNRSALGVVGAKVIRTPSDSLKYSYNWWIMNYGDAARDFGPRRQASEGDPFRPLRNRLGTPTGDANKYYVLSHEEFDYDLMFTAIDQSSRGWLQPPTFARDFAQGYDARYLLSFGPFKINPGQRLPISFSWVGGEDLHQGPDDFEKYFNPLDPDKYYSKLNFNNLAVNAKWASWVYDNPGLDTDGDGYSGKFRVCEDETLFYEGDGVPDFQGASPPPAPLFRIIPAVGNLTIRFNGAETENSEDVFSRLKDFEGYRVYIGRDQRESSYSIIATYDIEDYNKYIYEIDIDTTFRMNSNGDTVGFSISTIQSDVILKDPPFTIDSLRCLYGDSCQDASFNPLKYTQVNPFELGDSLFYFEPQDFNSSIPGINTNIKRRFPEQPFPTNINPQLANLDELTEEGLLKYYEYELLIDNLLPTVEYWVNVTAFDFGSPVADLASLETSVTFNAQTVYPLSSFDEVAANNLKAFVYPNPYIISDDYAAYGYENRLGNLATERGRRLHFANLPPKCTIRIFSLDGDLVREFEHDKDESDPTAAVDEWDMITRNTQSVVSGLYYFVIESEANTQIGKFAIIK